MKVYEKAIKDYIEKQKQDYTNIMQNNLKEIIEDFYKIIKKTIKTDTEKYGRVIKRMLKTNSCNGMFCSECPVKIAVQNSLVSACPNYPDKTENIRDILNMEVPENEDL